MLCVSGVSALPSMQRPGTWLSIALMMCGAAAWLRTGLCVSSDPKQTLQVAPEQRRALVSIACAVGVFIVTWHTMMGLLHSGAASEFAASLVKSPGSLLE